MLCSKCKNNPAVYHERIIHNGIVSEMFLCRQCKSETGFGEQALGMFKNLMSSFGAAAGQQQIKKNAVKCPACGCTSGEYLDTGFVGCPKCYEVFAAALEPAIKRLQKDARHTGKVPDKISAAEVEISKLLRRREEAVRQEDFMLAQELTDRINQIKGSEIKSRGEDANER